METKIKSLEFLEVATELKTKRQMMGVKATDFCKQVNLNQGNYSKIENGLANPGKVIAIIRVMFNKWRKERINTLKSMIKELEEIK